VKTYPIVERYDLSDLVTFKPNRKEPRHRWFFLQRGFLKTIRFIRL
jgi:hypothetical protein